MKKLKLILILLLTLGSYVKAENIIKSPIDYREYKAITLDNGMKFLLISDSKAQRAAAAVDVGIGSEDEPDDFPGLAHFLEHMLFLGTDLYPNPDDYINYISDHGGQHNAYTAFDHTNYFFDIDPDYLEGGLKRFSRFFVAPTFNEKYVDRERNAVNSEYQSKLREDGWRNNEVIKQVVNQKHPFARFSIGNNQTLPAKTVKKALLDFYNTYYSADLMSGVILGKESISTLEKYARKLFVDIVKRPTTINNNTTENLYDSTKLPKIVFNQSLKDKRELSLIFPIPYIKDNEYSKSLTYISYILGYEGRGSLFAELKKRGLASSLYAGSGQKVGKDSYFEIGIDLTPEGEKKKDEVIALTLFYIELLKNDPNSKERYKQISSVAEIAFKYQEKSNSIYEVSSLANRLNNYNVENILNLRAVYSGYNSEQIKQYLGYLTPKNLVVQLSSPKKLNEHALSPYFNVPYKIETIDINKIQKNINNIKGTDKLFLPKNNPFIADQYNLKKPKIESFEEVSERGVLLYYKNNQEFLSPKTSLQISLQLPDTLLTKQKVALSIFAELIDDQLNQELYDASIAGIHSSINDGNQSLNISIYGYSEKIPDLLSIILNRIKTRISDAKRFNIIKDDKTEELSNKKEEMPYQQTIEYLDYKIKKNYTLNKEKLQSIADINLADIQKIQQSILDSVATKVMVYGNETEDTARRFIKQIESSLSETNFNKKWNKGRTIDIETSDSFSFTTNHTDNAILHYIQAEKGYFSRAMVGLLSKFIEPEFFTKIRTEKQLGYIVFAFPKPTLEQAGLAFIIQSPVASASELKMEILQFNTSFIDSIQEIKIDEFNKIKQILITDLNQSPDNLGEAASRYWGDILLNNSTESSRQAIIKELEKIKLDDFKLYANQLLEKSIEYSVLALPKKPE